MVTGDPREHHTHRSAELQRLLEEAAVDDSSRAARPRPSTTPGTAATAATIGSDRRPTPTSTTAPNTVQRNEFAPSDSSDSNAGRRSVESAPQPRIPSATRARRSPDSRVGDPPPPARALRTSRPAPIARQVGAKSAAPPLQRGDVVRSFAGRRSAPGRPQHTRRSDLPAFPSPAFPGDDLPFPVVAPTGRAAVSPQQVARASSRAAEHPVDGGAGPGASSVAPADAPRRRQQRRAVVLAGGIAATVVAILGVTIGSRSGTDPAEDTATPPSKIAVVQSVDTSGRTTQVTVTAPVTAVAGGLVALVPGADGSTSSLPVVTPQRATPVTTAPVTGTPTAGTPTAGSPISGTSTTGASATETSGSAGIQVAGTSESSTSDRSGPSATSGSATPTTPTRARSTDDPATTGTAPTGAGGDQTATVVTGLTTLTGWIPITTR